MGENKCQMCFKARLACAEPFCEVTRGDYTLQVCEACKDKYEQEQTYKRIQPLVEALCRELNSCGSQRRNAQAFLDAFNHEHRTLQAEAFNLLTMFFRAYSNQDESRWFDGRNEHCRKLAKKWYESL